MRTWIVGAIFTGAVLLAVSASADLEADPAAPIVDETLRELPVDVPLNVDLAPDADQGADGGPGVAGSVPKPLADSAAVALVPARTLLDALSELGHHLASLLFGAAGQAAETYADANRLVAATPAESAVIALGAVVLVGASLSLSHAWQRYGSLGAIPLFSRIAKADVLENEVRNQIFELIQANPGINVSEISRRLDLAWGTTTHHLQKLRDARLVAIRVVAKQKCYFQNGGSYTPAEMDVLSATKNPTAFRIADHLVRTGPLTHGDLSAELGLTPSLVTFHMEKLVRAGVVARHREGRRTLYTPLETNLAPQPRPATHL